MRVLVSINYSEIMNEQTLQPLIQSKKINKIYIDHDWNIPKLPKVECYNTPKWLFYSPSPNRKLPTSDMVRIRDIPRGIVKTVVKLISMVYLAITRKPDLIIGFYLFPLGVYAFICGKISKKPVIVYIDDDPSDWRVIQRCLIPMLKRCDVVTITGTKNKEYLIKQGIDEHKIHILPDSIDTERFKYVTLPKRYDIISVGRLSPVKGFDTLLKAIAKVKAFKNDLKVGIVGDGHLRCSLEKLANQLGISENIEFLGWKENPEFYYNSAKIYVLTSRHEGLPMAVLEAMACGLPCVVSNVGDVTDAAINGVNAIVIDDSYDIDGFARAIIRLLNNSELYKSLSKNAKKMVKEKYCYESATKAWDEILSFIQSRR